MSKNGKNGKNGNGKKDRYADWMEADAQLKYWKDKEQELRKQICAEVLEGQSVGTHTQTINGYKIKAVKKINYVIDNDLLGALWDDLSEDEQSAIKFEPTLRIREYKRLDSSDNLDTFIMVKPAMPELSIEYVEEA